MVTIARLDSTDADFHERLDRVLRAESEEDEKTERVVRDIVADVRRRGDPALVEHTNRFDRRKVANAGELALSDRRLEEALSSIDGEHRSALELAAQRIRSYHQRQMLQSWRYEEPDGTLLGQQVTPLERVGLYVPGGKAAYPSSVLMNALPARVAGVPEIVMVVPAPDEEMNDLVLAAARIAGVQRVFTVGGAQAVAALAYGTETIPAVDKIVGPGNIFVATAKRIVFGSVGIDMVAGPSEILVVCDGHTPPDWIAMDLFSQAEHDEDARAILMCPDAGFLEQVEQTIERLLPDMERSDIIAASLGDRGALIRVRDLDEAVALVNRIAPEHLELSVREPDALAAQVRNAGAIFLGPDTCEAIGDYCAGPNHVLPTSRTARFSSPLGVYDFQKRSSLIRCSRKSARELGKVAARLARGERLTAHARSAEMRIEQDR